MDDPAKVLLDLAVALGLGGDCLADIAVLHAEPAVYGLVASDPTVSRTIDALTEDAPATLAAIHAARAAARERAWTLAGEQAPHAGIDAAGPLVIDMDGTLVTAHSDDLPHVAWSLRMAASGTPGMAARQLRPLRSSGAKYRPTRVRCPPPSRVIRPWLLAGAPRRPGIEDRDSRM
jgi:hypothetical protein